MKEKEESGRGGEGGRVKNESGRKGSYGGMEEVEVGVKVGRNI